jgi:DNA mismatch repair protein MutS2
LIVGIPQPSNAIHLAGQMGIDPRIIDRARSFLDREKLSIDELFKDLSRELAGVREEKAELKRQRMEYETKLADLKLRKKRELEDVKNRYQKEIVTSKRMVERLVKTMKKEKPDPATTRAVKTFYEQETKRIAEEKAAAPPYHPSIGEIVRIRDLKRAGQVVAQKNGRYKISLDNIFYWVDPVEIEPASAASP